MVIFAVDDERGSLNNLVRAIKGCEVDAVILSFSSSQEALDNAARLQPDVAFLDIQMPEIDGLELADKLKAINPHINVIFTTGYSEYAVEAMKMRSSGYLMKPVTKADVKAELENLRYQPAQDKTKSRIRVRTFGNFDVFVDGIPVSFNREKAKEMLALLVDKQGSSVTRKEIAAAIFEDRSYTRSTQSYLTQMVYALQKSLEAVGAQDMLIVQQNCYSINPQIFECDVYDYLAGKNKAAYRGEYMLQYSWAESKNYQFGLNPAGK